MALPIDPTTLGAFLLAVSALVLSPGPDTLIIMRYALASGARTGLAAVIGVQTGLVIHTALAIMGVSVIIASSPMLFKAIAVIGAIYIGWIGVQGFRETGMFDLRRTSSVSVAKAYRDAIMCNVLNPKVILMFLALFPNFINTQRDDVPAQLIMLAVILIIINAAWQAPIALGADVIRRGLSNPGIYRMVTRGTGVVLVGLALWMLVENLWQ